MKKLMITLLCAAFGGAQVLFSAEVKFVDYVETDGTQAIDTGFFVTPQTRITADFAYTDTTKQQRVFGAASDFDAPALSCALYINGNSLYAWAMCNGKGNWTSTGVTADTNRHLFVLDSVNNKYVLATGAVTNKTGALGTTRTKTAVWPLAIFANRNSESLEFNVYGKVRLYGFIIETNSVENGWIKVMDLKPVSIGESGGLYDLVSGEVVIQSCGNPLTASADPPLTFAPEIYRSVMSPAGEVKVYAKVDTLDGIAPCTLTAVVRDCVTGETTTKPLGVATDSELHEYKLSGFAPDGEYEITVHGSWPNLGSDGLESDLFVFQVSAAVDTAKGSIYMVEPDAELDGDPMGWLVKSSGLHHHRLPLDGDKIIIGQEPGTYALNITNAVTRTFNGWTGAGAANIVSETTIGAGSTLNITNTTAYGGNKSGSKASFVVDGGTLHIKVNATDNMYGTDTLTIKNGGTFLRDGASGQTHSIVMTGTSRIYLQDGTFTITPAKDQGVYNTLHFSGGTPAFIQTGGTASCGALSFQQQSDNYYEISGGSMTLSAANGGIMHGNRSGSPLTCGTLRFRGSKFTFASATIGYAYNSPARTLLPTFFDYRIRSDADPGAKGVGFIDYTATAVKGAVRAIPDGGVAIVHTNLFPLIVQRSKNALTFANDFKDNMASYRFMSTGLFDIGVPSGLAYMIRADLKPEAELADGWTSEEGVCAGFVKLPRIGNPSMLLKANLKLKVEPQGTKTLASIKSDLEAMGFGPVTADETAAYNLVVGLPKDRLAKGFADSKVLMDFTTVSGSKAMQSSTVTTNALIKAVALDILKPGLVLFVL